MKAIVLIMRVAVLAGIGGTVLLPALWLTSCISHREFGLTIDLLTGSLHTHVVGGTVELRVMNGGDLVGLDAYSDDHSYHWIEVSIFGRPQIGGVRFRSPYSTSNGFFVAIPVWVATLLLALWSWSFCVISRCIHMRRMAGRCAKCGYDLRGLSPDAGSACPECGATR